MKISTVISQKRLIVKGAMFTTLNLARRGFINKSKNIHKIISKITELLNDKKEKQKTRKNNKGSE
jgi:hypothetical protein